MDAIRSQTGVQQMNKRLALLAVLDHHVDHGIDYLVEQLLFVSDVVELPSPLSPLQFVDLSVEVQNEELSYGGKEVMRRRAQVNQLHQKDQIYFENDIRNIVHVPAADVICEFIVVIREHFDDIREEKMQHLIYCFTHVDNDRETVTNLVLMFAFLHTVYDYLFDNDDQIHQLAGDTVCVFFSYRTDEANNVILSLVVVYFFEVETQHLDTPTFNVVILEQFINNGDDLTRIFLLNFHHFQEQMFVQ